MVGPLLNVEEIGLQHLNGPVWLHEAFFQWESAGDKIDPCNSYKRYAYLDSMGAHRASSRMDNGVDLVSAELIRTFERFLYKEYSILASNIYGRMSMAV